MTVPAETFDKFRPSMVDASDSWYVAGPMRGIEAYNFPAFFAAEAKLLALGAGQVLNPAARDVDAHPSVDWNALSGNVLPREFSLREALAFDVAYICNLATHILLLPGWRFSKGAIAEAALGHALGLTIVELDA